MEVEDILEDAEDALELGDYQEAIEILDGILEDGINIKALRIKGDALRLSGDPKESMKCYDRALVVDLNQKDIWRGKGSSLSAIGRNDEALRSFERALKYDPEDVETWLEKGRLGMKVHDWKMSLDSFKEVCSLDPENPDGWFNKGNALISGFGKMEEAIECYKKAVEIRDDSPDYWFNLGVAQRSFDEILDACRSFFTVLELQKTNIKAKRYLNECKSDLEAKGIDFTDIVTSEKDIELKKKSRPSTERRRDRAKRKGEERDIDIGEWTGPSESDYWPRGYSSEEEQLWNIDEEGETQVQGEEEVDEEPEGDWDESEEEDEELEGDWDESEEEDEELEGDWDESEGEDEELEGDWD